MKWPHVKNLNFALATLLLILLGSLNLIQPASLAEAKKPAIKGQMQIGFYDLLSDQKEVYDSQIMDMDGALLFTLTQRDDALFVIRGRLDETQRKRGRVFYDYAPVRYNNPANFKMIFSFIDFLRHNNVWVYPMTINKKSLVIGQSGMMFLFPLTT